MNSRIRIARTNNLENLKNTINGDIILADGQPFYDKKSNALYIGDGETTLENLDTSINAGLYEGNLILGDAN